MRWSSASLPTLLVLLALLVAPAAAAVPDPVGEWPLSPVPEVVADFEPPSSAWGPGHRGVDLLGTAGARVRSALPGTVSFVGLVAGRGVVSVDHGETRTTYQPVTTRVRRGKVVAAGEVLGRLALPGSHCFPRACLHWGWLRGRTYLDPLRLVGGGPVRLLPLGGLPGSSTGAPGRATALRRPYAGWQPWAAWPAGRPWW